jgi:ribonuclease HI
MEKYHKGSGQLVNKNKSAIFFSSNCVDEVKSFVRKILGIDKEALEERYLGLPTALGRNTTAAFEKITTQVKNLVGGVCEKNLSMAGREVLVKSNAQAIPTYSMSSFLLSKNTCKKITSAMAKYWWGGDGEKRKMHWKKWEDIAVPKSEGGMGFRDMRLFNIAMLGKQGWRLLTNPDSLCARVLRGKYYHDKECMKATKKKNMSHTWRAILVGRQALELGMIKRIGNGTSTDVWKDKWIPGVPGFKPLCKGQNATARIVSDLMTNDGWNQNALRENLLPLDAEAVTRIPLGKLEDDQWAWAPQRNGVYTVKSAYNLLSREAQNKKDKTESSNAVQGDPWKSIWKLHVPPKIQSFWWRVIHDFVPVRNNLKKCHVEKLSQCVDCGAERETTYHTLVECTFARCFWKEMKTLTGIKLPPLHPVTWARDILDAAICPSDHISVILCGMWAVWCERNNRRHGEEPRTWRAACRWAIDTALDLAQEAKPKAEVNTGVHVTTGWTKPEAGVLKLNCDGAFNAKKHTGSTGCIIRDSNGRALGARARWYRALADALHAEALAVRDGVAFCGRWRTYNLRVETDSQMLVNLWKKRKNHRAEIIPILHEIEEISKVFSSFEISYVPRNANLAAHYCAKEASPCNPECMWIGREPTSVESVIQLECNPT